MKYHPNIIGKRGVTINKIREEHDVRIQLPEKDHSHSQDIVIIGYEHQVHSAKEAILKIVRELVSEFIHLFFHPSIYLFIHLSIYISIYSSIYLSIYLFIHLSIHPSIYPSIYLSIYSFFHPSYVITKRNIINNKLLLLYI